MDYGEVFFLKKLCSRGLMDASVYLFMVVDEWLRAFGVTDRFDSFSTSSSTNSNKQVDFSKL